MVWGLDRGLRQAILDKVCERAVFCIRSVGGEIVGGVHRIPGFLLFVDKEALSCVDVSKFFLEGIEPR